MGDLGALREHDVACERVDTRDPPLTLCGLGVRGGGLWPG